MTYPTTTANTVVTSPFGWRIHPITGVRTFHWGMDIAPTDGTKPPIYACQAGTVAACGYDSVLGYYVWISHSGDSYHTLYQHLDSYSVAVNDTILESQQIGVMGTSGSSTGVHLHFAVSVSYPATYNPAPGTFRDPEDYLATSNPPVPVEPAYYNLMGRQTNMRRDGRRR